MADFIFRVSPNIVLGEYTGSRLADYASEEGARYIVVMDPVLGGMEAFKKILTSLTDKGVGYFVMNEISDGAQSKTIERALSLARDGHATGVIAIGGGKTLAIGRAIAAMSKASGGVYEYLDGAVVIPDTDKGAAGSPLTLICVPTTMRDAFMFSQFIPVVDSRKRRARLVKVANTRSALCRLALIDPNLTLSLDESKVASMTLEVLSLILEAYLSQRSSFFSDMLAEKAAQLLRTVIGEGTELSGGVSPALARSQAGCMASLAAATSAPGVPTMIAWCISAHFAASRSVVSSIMLPHIIADAAKFKADRVASIARMTGVAGADADDAAAAQALADAVRQMQTKAQLPVKLQELSLTIEQLAPVVENASEMELMTALPRSMTADDLFDLIKVAY